MNLKIKTSHNNNDIKISFTYFNTNILVLLPKGSQKIFIEKLNRSFSIEYNKQLKFKDSDELRLIFKIGGKKLDIVRNTIVISENVTFEQLANDAINILSKIFEREINKKGIFSVHGAGITYENNGLLLLGDNGSGKTSSAVAVCIKDPQIKIISGNRVFLNSNNIIGGINIINLRYGSIISELNSFEQIKQINQQIEKQNSWETRLFLNPEELNICINKNYPIKLTAIVFIKKLPKSLTIFEADNKSIYLRELYESVSRWGDRAPYVAGSMIHFPDIFSYEIKSERMKIIGRFLRSVPILFLEGNLNDVSDYLKKIIRG